MMEVPISARALTHTHTHTESVFNMELTGTKEELSTEEQAQFVAMQQ